MTTKVLPLQDAYFMTLVSNVERYCADRECRDCAKLKACRVWFNGVSQKSTFGELNQSELERQMSIFARDIIQIGSIR